METTVGRRRWLLGLDVGTQSLRAALVDEHGRTVAYGVAPIETTYPKPTWAEQQSIEWWSAAGEAVRSALAQGGVAAEEVVGMGLDCTACMVFDCDAELGSLRLGLLWMDQR